MFRCGEESALSQGYDEVQVFDGIAERTGNHVDLSAVRGRREVCGSITALAAKSRRLGDGLYYLRSDAWPAGDERVDLNRPWEPMG